MRPGVFALAGSLICREHEETIRFLIDFQPLELTIPFALKATSGAIEVLLIAAQIHLAVVAYGFLRRKNARLAVPVSLAVGAVGLFLIGISELVTMNLEAHALAHALPAVFHLMSAVHVLGTFGAYSAYLTWLIARRWVPDVSNRAEPSGGISRRVVLDRVVQTAMVAPFVVGGYGSFIGRDDFEIRETELSVAGLPKDLDGLRMAQISDVHYGPYLGKKELERIVAMANELRPQITFLTGDFITRQGDPLEECLDILSNLKADSGLWGCLGNHEDFAKCGARTKRYAASKGIEILRQESRELRFGQAAINLVGVDYQWTSREYLPNAADLVRPDTMNLLLSHNPDVFPKAAEIGYDITLAGHTHGGQITVEIVEQTLNPGRFFTPFVVGRYKIADKLAYVTRGVGTVNMPMRIGARPEVSSLILRSA